jgi:hypothetical protein
LKNHLQKAEKILPQPSAFSQNNSLCVSRYTYIAQAAPYATQR